jgi:hypothetical protein
VLRKEPIPKPPPGSESDPSGGSISAKTERGEALRMY